MSNVSNYFKKIIWVIGLIILVKLSFDFKIHLQQTAQMEFNIVPVLWYDVMISLLLGWYISILLVQKWSVNVNHALLWCVAVPCLIILLIYPTVVTLAVNKLIPESFSYSFITAWFFKVAMPSPNVVGIVAGMTLAISIFSNDSKVAK
ncbi:MULTISPECIES: hypothetical protein [Solibacillus]|uniref:Uncharacterized protein n=1 Tax=Solibacillus merdavium TaxID=2762218 RepID=A0ABR8XM03_9BACL|nr:hypothetical protein [Solibacillus merdavium]MBD8032973.1 hypothetical protein [Solibacillus merdavium]